MSLSIANTELLEQGCGLLECFGMHATGQNMQKHLKMGAEGVEGGANLHFGHGT